MKEATIAGTPKRTPRRQTRIPMAKRAPQAWKLKAAGLTQKQIAEKLGVSERYVRDLLRYAQAKSDAATMVVEIPDPKAIEDITDPEVLECLEYSWRGFEKFVLRYSEYEYVPQHAKMWVTDALANRRLVINTAPRHAKSEIISVWFVIWLTVLGNPPGTLNRNTQILIVSQTEKLAKKFTNKVSFILANNRTLIKDFGRFRPEFTDWPWRPGQGELMVEGRDRHGESGDLSIQVRGAGQMILGMAAHWIIADDPTDTGVTASPTERTERENWFHSEVMSRLEPGGHAVVIGQRLALNDLYGHLRTVETDGQPVWNIIEYPAVLDWEAKKVLWPERWSFNELMEVRSSVTPRVFEVMYQQNPLPESERLARDAWLYGDDAHAGCIDRDRRVGQGIRDEEPTAVARVLSIDPSPTAKAALVVSDVNVTTQVQTILEMQHRPMQVRDMTQEIDRVLTMYRPDYFIFEINAAQRWFLQDKDMDRIKQAVRVIPHTTNRNKSDPILGLESLALDFEYGRIRLPYADPEARVMAEHFFKEARTYPEGDADDQLMAVWFIKNNTVRLVPPGLFSAQDQTKPRFNVPPRLKRGFSYIQRNRRTH